MTGVPPSDSGGCHDNVTLSAVISDTWRGPTGADGLSTKQILSPVFCYVCLIYFDLLHLMNCMYYS